MILHEYDGHSRILPGFDDGAEDLSTSTIYIANYDGWGFK